MKKIAVTVSTLAAYGLKLPIYAYRYTLSALIGWRCRHAPSCSLYALDAIDLNGAWRGFWLTLSRISRCHPWGTGGFDPAPDIRNEHHPVWAAWRYGRWRECEMQRDGHRESIENFSQQ